MVSKTGRLFTFGDAAALTSAAPPPSGATIADMAATPTGRGVWMVSSAGQVYAFGDARALAPAAPVPAKTVIVAITSTASGAGAWLVSSTGTVLRFGDAPALTSTTPPPSGTTIADAVATPTRRGLWMASTTGKLFNFGDAPALTSTSPPPAKTTIVGITSTVTGAGAWLVGSTGTVFRFGDATALTPAAAPPSSTTIADVAATPTGVGFWLTSHTGTLFRYGDAAPLTSPAPPPSNTVVVALVTAPRTTLSVTASGPATVSTGGTVDYTIVVKNTGTVPATGVSLTVDLPASGTFVSSSPASARADGRATVGLGAIAAGATAAVALRWTAPPTATTLHLQAHARGDAAAAVDSAAVDTTVTVPRTTLAVTAGGPSPITAGTAIDYAFSVTNAGGSAASAVRLTVDVPTTGAFLSSVPTGTPAAGKLELGLGAVAAGASANATVRWTAPATATTMHVTAHAVASNADAVDSATFDTVVELAERPPDVVAPPLDNSAVTSTAEGTSFLYTGAAAPQVSVTAGAIDPKRAAVLRGRVLGRNEAALPGVTVRILDHPELGRTVSRTDGRFDLAVNGGGVLVLEFEKTGYLSAQRPVDTDAQDFTAAPDVVLVALDAKVTAVDLSATIGVQVAQGSEVTDSSGTRQATLLVNPGTSARMTLPDGTERDLANAHLRATEFTVGSTGERAMPGALPPSSGYTWAADYSFDEALTAEATSVRFNKPVYTYVENFLHFPAGTTVPSGSYDRIKAVWVAEENGRVVEVVAITGGLAELDTDGNGSADNDATLGITDAERAKLAGLYSVGESLWRVPVDHFSSWDSNWGVFPPADAAPPKQPEPDPEQPQDKPQTKCGSVIECENQILGEHVAVAGTPYSLAYDSSRTPGRRAGYTLRIPLTGASVPASAVSVDLSVQVAGQSFRRSFPAAPNLSTTYTWDGRDAYGRTVLGKQPVHVQLAYTYAASYARTDRFGYNGNGIISADGARGTISLSQNWTGTVGAWDGRAAGLGGWSLDVHHAYDPFGKVLYRGDGARVSATGGGVNAVINQVPGTATYGEGASNQGVAVAADGTVYVGQQREFRVLKVTPEGETSVYAGGRRGSGGDGALATAAGLTDVRGLAVGRDGSLYIADGSSNRIRRVAPDGIISTFAGTGGYGSTGNGGPATSAQIRSSRDVAVGPDGSVFICEGDSSQIRRVTPDGAISTYAGTYGGFSGDGGQATSGQLASPSGIDVAADGTLYIADTNNYRIRKVTPNGIITTVVGNGSRGYGGLGGPATSAAMSDPTDVAVRPSGELLTVDSQGGGIREMSTDGILRSVILGGSVRATDGQPAGLSQVYVPWHLAVGPTGTLYVNDTFNNRLVQVASPLFGFSASDVVIPSEDGAEVFQFDAVGRHKSTVDALTGTTLYLFTYDDKGRLTQVTDRDDNVTTIERNTDGDPTAIVGPYGRRTTLTTTPAGYLSTVTNPAGDVTRFGYGTTGLLGTLTDPRGGAHTFAYDAAGRLASDADPTGATQRLAFADMAGGRTVTLTSAEGNVTTYRIEALATGGQVRTMTEPGNQITRLTERADGSRSESVPSGTTTTWQLTGDPRFGMLAPVTSTRRTVLPSGLARAETRSVESVSSGVTLTSAVNSRATTVVYTAATRTLVDTSQAGRRLTRVLDAKGRVTSLVAAGRSHVTSNYDARGRLSSVAESAGASTRTTTLTYSAAGDLASVTDPLGRTSSFSYDAAGRRTSETAPDGAATTMSYDRNGNLEGVKPPGRDVHTLAHTDRDELSRYVPPPLSAGGEATDYAYNADGRLTAITLPDGRSTAFSYDSAGRIAGSFTGQGQVAYSYNPDTGSLAGLTAPGGVNLTYARNGSLLTSEVATGPAAGTVARAYDSDFRTSSLSSAGLTTPITYDADGLDVTVGELTINRAADSGLVTGTTLGGVSDTRSYDGFGDPRSFSATFNGTALLSRTQTRDALGRVVSEMETVGGTTRTTGYSYDAVGQLTGVLRDGEAVAEYAYDANGNRVGSGLGAATATTVDSQDRVLRAGNATYTSTANGDLRTRSDAAGTTTYAYDSQGNLRSLAKQDGTAVTYVTDGRNRRVGKRVDGTQVQGFLYQDDLRPIAELDGSGAVVSRFVYDSRDGAPAYFVKGASTYRILTDSVGSPRLVVNVADGEIAQSLTYDAFGGITTDSNPGFQPFGFAGGLYDRDSRLTRFGARDYSAELGRWTAKDPLIFADGTGLYTYAHNDPVNRTDREGLDSDDATIECSADGGYQVALNSFKGNVLEKCVVVHEESHIKDWEDRYGKGSCNGSLPQGSGSGWVSYDDFLQGSECTAYKAERDCQNAARACSMESREKMEKEAIFVEEKIKEYCGGS